VPGQAPTESSQHTLERAHVPARDRCMQDALPGTLAKANNGRADLAENKTQTAR